MRIMLCCGVNEVGMLQNRLVVLVLVVVADDDEDDGSGGGGGIDKTRTMKITITPE